MTKRIGLLMLALGACTTGDADVPEGDDFCGRVEPNVEAYLNEMRAAHPVPDDPRYGGTAVMGGLGDLTDGMMSLVSSDFAAVQHQQFVNLMTLVQYDEDYQPLPYLAESWDVTEDGTELTFHLRDDVFWHDGERTDAHDVAFTYLRVTDPRTAFPNAGYWDTYVRGPDGVEVLDDFTVRFRMRPHQEFLDTWRQLAIMPEHLLGGVLPEELGQHPYGTRCPVGNGPFVFREHRPLQHWVFEANPGFPEGLGGRPFLDRYVYRIIPEQTTLLTELLTERIDVYNSPPPDQIARIVEADHLELRSFPFRQFVFVAWNTRRPQLGDARVRRALALATDREEIVETLLQGYGRLANGSVPPFHWAFDEAAGELPHDPDRARALLNEAGWVDRDGDGVREDESGLPLEVEIKYNSGNQRRRSIVEIMQAQLARVGVAVIPRVVEWTTLAAQITNPEDRDFDAVVLAWVTDFRLNDMDLFHSERADQPYAFSGLLDPDMDRVMEQLAATAGQEEATPLWAEYQRMLAETQPFLFLYWDDRIMGINERLRNVEMDMRGEWLNIRQWWIEPDRR